MIPVEGWNAIQIQILRLGDAIATRQIKTIRLVKVDVEGHEHRVLRGMESFLREGRVKWLLLEFNDYWLQRQGSSAKNLAEYCRSLGFKLVHGALPKENQMTSAFWKHEKE